MQVNNGVLHFEMKAAVKLGEIKKEAKYAYLDADKLEWPLLFRTWQATDYFYPLGLRKKKKTKSFFRKPKIESCSQTKNGCTEYG